MNVSATDGTRDIAPLCEPPEGPPPQDGIDETAEACVPPDPAPAHHVPELAPRQAVRARTAPSGASCEGPEVRIAWNGGRPTLEGWLASCRGSDVEARFGFVGLRVSPGSVHAEIGGARARFELPIGSGARLEIEGRIAAARGGFGLDFRDGGAVLTQEAEANAASVDIAVETPDGERSRMGAASGLGAGMTAGATDSDGDGNLEIEAGGAVPYLSVGGRRE